MLDFFLSVFQGFILVAALSIDAFVASFAYGADKIRVPPASVLVICLVCSGILGVSMAVGSVIQPYLPPNITHILGFLILLILGVVRLFDSMVKNFIRKHQPKQKNLHFCLAGLSFILQIYVDSTAADRDRSRLLSPGEAASLAFALSIDGLAVGIGAGLTRPNLLVTILLSLLLTAAAVLLGGKIGRQISKSIQSDLSWLSGVMLIALAFFKL